MSRRAYQPRFSTLDLVRRIRALDGVQDVEIHAPFHYSGPKGGLTKYPARIRVHLTRRWPGEDVYTDFSFKQAREWLATEEGVKR